MPTSNPVPSQDPSDLLFNAGKLDEALNGTGNSFTDRLGVARRTVAGMNADFDAQLADAESDLNVYRADAAASAAQALGYLNTIRTTSYGAYAADPVWDPLGNPPNVGDEYFNTTANLLKRWNGTTWQASDINTANLAAYSGSSLIGYDTGTVQDVLDAVTGPNGAASVGYTPAGTGAVATTANEKLSEFVSVTDYMNVFEKADSLSENPVLDHTAAIQKALDTNNFVDFLDGRNYRVNGNLTKAIAANKTFEIRGKSNIKRYSTTGATLRVTGEASSRIHAREVLFDGNESGVIRYSSGNPVAELVAVGVGTVIVKARFTKTSYASVIAISCGDVKVSESEFSEGVPWYGSASATTTYHIQVSQCKSLSVKSNKFYSSIVYDPGNYNSSNPQNAVLAVAPIAVYADYTDSVSIRYNECDNSGYFDVYEKVKYVRINRNKIKNSHGPLKVQSFLRAEIEDNVIDSPLHYWGGAISASPYSRLTTYGWLGPDQGDITIRGNKIYNCRSREGVIAALGALYSTATLDQRISQQGGSTTNIVYKVGSDYFYKDFDGTITGPLSQEYLAAKSITIEDNRIEKFATTGILASLSSSEINVRNNRIFRAASLDTPYGYTKVAITATDAPIITVEDNLLSMKSSDVPMVNGVESAIIGILASCQTYMKNNAVYSISGNIFSLGYVSNGVFVYDSNHLKFKDNTFSIFNFKPGGFFFRAGRRNNIGRFSGNVYSAIDATNAPSAASEYANAFANFNTVVNDDVSYSAATRNVRSIASSLDYTTPNQVASGVYGVGSVIKLDSTVNKRFWRCETAGGLANLYAAGTSYSEGNNVKSAEGNYFVANKTNLGITPPATATSNADWTYLTSSTATFVEYTVIVAT